MRRWLFPSSYHSVILFVFMGVCAAVTAWVSFGLIVVAIANIELLKEHGMRAALDGGLVQLVEIAAQGAVALLAFLGFKGAEVELIRRWRWRDD